MMKTIKQVAEQLNVSLRTIYGAVERGELVAHKFGRRQAIRISEDNLRKFIDGCVVQKEETPRTTQKYRHLKF